MVKKQSMAKSPRKTKATEPSSSKPSDPQNDPMRFWRMNFIAERGFNIDKAPDAFTAAVTALGWGQFIKHRGSYVVPVVREFYQGIPPPKEGKPQTYSVVRGEIVDFSPSAINEFFKLGYSGKALEKKINTWGRDEMEEVRKRICVEESTWEKFGSEFKLKKTFLVDEAAMWFTFIRHSLMPTSHTTNVEKDRLIVLDAILEGEKIDVGKIIAREIEKSRAKTEGNLYFPCLITELCKLAEVEIEVIKDERRSPTGAIPAVFKPRQRSSAIAPDAIALNQLKKNQQALCKFVKAKFEWEKSVLEKLSRGKELMEPPVFPEWIIEDEDVQEPPQDDERITEGAAIDELKKRSRSPILQNVKSPAKKRRKVSSEESLNTADLEEISEEDEEETRQLMKEVKESEEEEDSDSGEESGQNNPEKEEGSESDVYEEIPADPTPSPTRPSSPLMSSPQTHNQVMPETPQSEPNIPPPNQTVTKSPSPSHQQHPISAPSQAETQPPSPVTTKEPNPEEPPQQKSQSSDVEAASAIASDAIASPVQQSPTTTVSSATKSPRLKQRANRSPKTKTHHLAGTEEEAQAMAASPIKEVVEGPILTGTPEPALKEKHAAKKKRPTYTSARKNPGAKLAAIEEDVVEEADKEEEQKGNQRPGEEVSEQEQEAASKLVEMMASKEAGGPSASAIASAAIAPDQGQKEKEKEKKKGKAAKPAQPSRVSARTRSSVVKK